MGLWQGSGPGQTCLPARPTSFNPREMNFWAQKQSSRPGTAGWSLQPAVHPAPVCAGAQSMPRPGLLLLEHQAHMAVWPP